MSLRRFTLVYIATLMALMVLVVLAQAVTGYDIANAGMSIIPAMSAGMAEGQFFVRSKKRMPENAEMWHFARQATVVMLGLTMVAVAIFSVAVPQIRFMLSQPSGGMLLLAAVLFQVALSFLLVRYFLGLGAKSALRAEQDRANKN
ncbi:ABZJ_00895 family protein [Phaeobacter sp. HF9A]|uniref:ABZJ_00895 family protein n=1 Tax=Phaeobacter sp. HF9A TaxID=2721561 RepID=UPI00142FB903|nr:ABZJ_00895 family protein [Phaeobacter sp. HF9A]NIZ15528.1 hypothetical protein [Phaeobacter sp. HF9A]